MGTIFEQPEREHYRVSQESVERLIDEVKEVSLKHKISIETALEFYKLAEERRRNTLYVNNGDIFDEHMSGLARLIDNTSSAIEGLRQPM